MAATSKTSDQPAAMQDKHINFFPNLPPYSDPKTGLLSKLPSSWIPYAQLMRIDRPGGLYAFYFPYLIGIMYAACILPTTVEPLTLLMMAAVLLPLNILLRGAACTWNDTLDQEFDRRVERCRHRPVARGAVSTRQAHIFTCAQLAAGYPILRFFPVACTWHMLIMVVLFFIYAYMKRVHTASTFALYAANVLWTITYDTIYAHQDIADDEKAGVKGMAVRFRDSTKLLASILATMQVALLALSGLRAGFGPTYFVGTVGGVAAAMGYYIYDVDLKNPQSCGTWFGAQFWIVGAGFMAGLTGEYILSVAP
ncbi:hypothetical protein APSETT444_009062 [Aspergillus pseudonomiae]